MSGKLPYLPLFTGDWIKDPALSRCSEATRGIWIDLLCAMHENGRSGLLVGTVTELCRMSRSSPACLAPAITELSTYGVAQVQERDGVITITNRRMKRESNARRLTRKRVANHRVRKKKRECNDPSSSSYSISGVRDNLAVALTHPSRSAQTAPEIRKGDEKTGVSVEKPVEKPQKSRFTLKECQEYAATLKGIASPKALGKSMWRLGEDDDDIAEFLETGVSLGHSGNSMKKLADTPVDVAEWLRAADELERVGLKDHAAEMRAALKRQE